MQISLKAKLGSLVVHCQEMFSSDGHYLDTAAIKGIIADPDVLKFIKELQKDALVPVQRKPR